MGQSRPLILAALLAGCSAPPKSAAPVERPIALPALVDLAPAAGLDSLVEAHPQELLKHPELLSLVYQVVPQSQLQAFAARHGGVDPLRVADLVVATYGNSTLALAEGDFDGARVERAFADRTVHVSSRTIDRAGGPLSRIVRLEGEASNDRVAMVLFGRRAVAVESHTTSQLRASELFALGKLTRARPALKAAPLDAAATALGDAPVRIFFPGPFEGESAKGLAGVLRAAHAVAIAIRPHFSPSGGDRSDPNDLPPNTHIALDVTIDVLGTWADDASKGGTAFDDSGTAGHRFAAAIDRIARSDLGRLCGLDQPIRGPVLEVSPSVLSIFAVIDAERLASGARAATGSQIDEIMK